MDLRTQDVKVTSSAKMVKDLNESYHGQDTYYQGRNVTTISHDGNRGTIQFEQGNKLVFSAPYKIINITPLPEDNQYLVFSTDNVNSEIGIANDKTGAYEKLTDNKCLNFNYNFPIKTAIKKDFNREIVVTFTDKYNPVRRAYLKELRNLTNCDDILLWKKIDIPKIELNAGLNGNLKNGTYTVFISYAVDRQKYSDYYGTPQVLQIFSEQNNTGSIEVTLKNIDKEFEEFELILIVNNQGFRTAYRQGWYSKNQSKIIVSDLGKEELPLSDLVLKNKTWQKAGIISSNSNYLILADLIQRKELNYQPKAMNIKAEYVVVQVPADYYKNEPKDFGYYRDERYSFDIEGIYNTGETTASYHITGPKPKSWDLALASGADVYEFDEKFQECDKPNEVRNYQVYNTAGNMIPVQEEFKCNRRVIGYGELGFWQSTELYPDNKELFGEDAGKPQRHFMFPDEEKVPRYTNINGRYYINILGVRFKDIPSFEDTDIIGYRILRRDREGNRSVIARGMLNNTRSYFDTQNNTEVYYSNYPYNDLSEDKFQSGTQTVFKNKRETKYTPLNNYFKDKFTFYSPHSYFFEKYRMGTEWKIESEEIAQVKGRFEIPHNHPKHVLLTQFAFWISAAVGFIESTLVFLGSSNITSSTGQDIEANTTPPSIKTTTKTDATTIFNIKTVDDLLRIDPIALGKTLFEQSTNLKGLPKTIALISKILTLLATAVIKLPYSVLKGIETADILIESIEKLSGPIQYAYQCNSSAFYNSSLKVPLGNKRRYAIDQPFYLSSALHTINDKIYNNAFREKSVFVEFNKEIKDPITKDNSRNTISGFRLCNSANKDFTATSSAYYATSKIANPNQYGQVGSALPILISQVIFNYDVTPVLFGGDCVIARFQLQKRHKFFSQDLAANTFPDKTEYDYRLYRNVAYPRYWMDSTKFSFAGILSRNVVNQANFTRTTTSKYNLDCKQNDSGNPYRVDNSYFYTSNNGVMDFFCEVDYNISFREDTQYPHYSENNTNISQIFRADRLIYPEEFKLNRAYKDLFNREYFNQQLRTNFKEEESFPIEQPNSVIYSLPSFNLQSIDNWRYFLPNNFFSFRESDFGILTNIHKLDQDRLIFLMSRSSPYISMGRDFLELEQSGRKVTIGDGGLFAQDPREIMPTDNNYGSTNSPFAFSNTHMGRFYVSEQGRIMNFTEGLDDIARQGLQQWCSTYMPFKIKEYYPDYTLEENPIVRHGYYSVFDAQYGIVYITKRDFIPKSEYKDKIIVQNNEFFYDGLKIELHSDYFKDVSWTLSYSPEEKGFISYHDWHPDGVVQKDKHFLTVKDNTVWEHNTRTDLYCNYYKKDYPAEIEPIFKSNVVEIITSIQYVGEAYQYKNNNVDKTHIQDYNFDTLVVSNSKQCSPFLELKRMEKLSDRIEYQNGKRTQRGYEILFTKREEEYNINQFWDATKNPDEGEFHIWHNDESGYKKVINPLVLDLDSPNIKRTKFRHNWTKFFFAKEYVGNIKFLSKLFRINKTISIS